MNGKSKRRQRIAISVIARRKNYVHELATGMTGLSYRRWCHPEMREREAQGAWI